MTMDGRMSECRFRAADVQRIIAETHIATVELHDSLCSTNDRALEIAAAVSREDLPRLILAESQTAGRGRGEINGGQAAAR